MGGSNVNGLGFGNNMINHGCVWTFRSILTIAVTHPKHIGTITIIMPLPPSIFAQFSIEFIEKL